MGRSFARTSERAKAVLADLRQMEGPPRCEEAHTSPHGGALRTQEKRGPMSPQPLQGPASAQATVGLQCLRDLKPEAAM